LRHLQPPAGAPSKELWIKTRSSWVAVFHNLERGGDLIAPVSLLCETIGCRGLAVTCHPNIALRKENDGWSGTYGGLGFALFSPDSPGPMRYQRHILLYNDGGKWKFLSEGSPQNFEHTEPYTSLRVRDRFSIDMLRDYCAALGIRAFESGFYGPNAMLIEHTKNGMPVAFPLDEVQRRLGIDRRKTLRF